MSKESTPLQAFENIIETFWDQDTKDIKTVRNTLKAVEILKGNISLEFIHPFKSVRYEVWLNRGDEEPILIANTREEYELLMEVFK